MKITIESYAAFVHDFWRRHPSTAKEPESGSAHLLDLSICSLGMAGETGEVVEHVKKLIRDGKLDYEEIKLELGDVIYYWFRLCEFFGLDVKDVLEANIEKLKARRAKDGRWSAGLSPESPTDLPTRPPGPPKPPKPAHDRGVA